MGTALNVLVERVRVRRRLPDPQLRRVLRKSAGLSQGEIAAALGVTRSTVCRWEGGRREPRHRMLAAYVALLDRLARDAARRDAAPKRR
jgi:transcriptional regulator with XRE-family HTH domain